ncbi:MAG: serine hydrolase [Acidimicrobiales bacterium]|nr:serine hydrolase [Acidimicrobiales bacterium]
MNSNSDHFGQPVSLPSLKGQPPHLEWPTIEWPVGTRDFSAKTETLIEELFVDSSSYGETYSLVVIKDGELVVERYSGQLPSFDERGEVVSASTQLLSWSMAKSMLHAVVGILVKDELISLTENCLTEMWKDPDDPRSRITLKDLLEMRDGLDFSENYVESEASDVIEMLFGKGQNDVARYAMSRPSKFLPGEHFNYSSGTSNIVSSIVSAKIGYGNQLEKFINSRLLSPIGVKSSRLGFDEKGTWVASSYAYLRARDAAKFGYLYLRGGNWNGLQIVPSSWVDQARTPLSLEEESGWLYSKHWWCANDRFGTFFASGYEGQFIFVVPALDMIIVRFGRTTKEKSENLINWRDRLLACVSEMG